MRYIVTLSSENFQRMTPYFIKSLGKKYAVVEIEDEKMPWLKTQVERIEPDFNLSLGHLFWYDLGQLADEKVMIVTVGKYFLTPHIQYTYEMRHHKWEAQVQPNNESIWIHCYTQSGEVQVSDLLMSLEKLYKLSELLKRPLMIVAHLESKLPYFKINSLAQDIAESYLERKISLVVLQGDFSRQRKFSRSHFEHTLKHMVYANMSTHKLQEEMYLWLLYRQDLAQFVSVRQNHRALYNDIFYQQITPAQPIYLPLNLLESEEPSYYHHLGLHTVYLGKQQVLLYGEKQLMDENRVALWGKIYPNFENPILTRVPIHQLATEPIVQKHSMNLATDYTGEGVYIGIITEEGVDYTRPFLRTSTGDSRIFGYWVQEEGDNGTYYTRDQINDALKCNDPNSVVPLARKEGYTTTLLGIAGGKMEGYESMAKKSQFLVAKIKAAPKNLQTIYGGDANQTAVLMPDLLIAAYKMLEIAEVEKKPLVLIIPYNTNLSAHDGTGVYEQLLSHIGKQQGCSIIIPTGEEGNKNHHQTVVDRGNIVPDLVLKVSHQTESLVGCIYLKSDSSVPIRLYPPDEEQTEVRLDEAGRYVVNGGTIYTTGIIDNFQNGAGMIHFRVANMKVGKWRMEYAPSMIQRNAKIDIWLAQQELNPYVTLEPSTPFISLGSNATIAGLLSIGGYDHNNLVVLAASGRGYNWGGDIVPDCVTLGKVRMLSSSNEWCNIEGTAISASFLAGTVALLYEKWCKEEGMPYANSLIMHSKILNSLERFSGVSYPNPNQGYGVLKLQDLPNILRMD